MQTPDFARYAAKIAALPKIIQRADVISNEFLLAREDNLGIYYAPLHGVTQSARVAVVGLTPGLSQMTAAFAAARELLASGWQPPELYHEIRRRMAFAGSMRRNLIAMLDDLGVAKVLDLTSTSELFADASHLLHATSAFRYPVFVDGRNYTGHRPTLRRSAALNELLIATLPAQLKGVPGALLVPLGKAVELALQEIDYPQQHVLAGFPHPSGANGHRFAQFNSNQEALRDVVRLWDR